MGNKFTCCGLLKKEDPLEDHEYTMGRPYISDNGNECRPAVSRSHISCMCVSCGMSGDVGRVSEWA